MPVRDLSAYVSPRLSQRETGGLEDAPHFGKNFEQIPDELPIVGFVADAARVILALPPVGRACHAAVEGAIGQSTQDGTRLALQKKRLYVVTIKVGLQAILAHSTSEFVWNTID